MFDVSTLVIGSMLAFVIAAVLLVKASRGVTRRGRDG